MKTFCRRKSNEAFRVKAKSNWANSTKIGQKLPDFGRNKIKLGRSKTNLVASTQFWQK